MHTLMDVFCRQHEALYRLLATQTGCLEEVVRRRARHVAAFVSRIYNT